MVNYYSIENILESCSIETENKWNNLVPKEIENIINDMLFETIEQKKENMLCEIKNLETKYYYNKIMNIHGVKYDCEEDIYISVAHPYLTGVSDYTEIYYKNVFSSISLYSYEPYNIIRIKNGIEIMKGYFTVNDLKKYCKINNLKKYSRLRRKELIQLLMTI